MLQKIRDGSSGPLAYVVVGLITVVFGVWGIGSYFTPSSDPVVASAGDTQITNSQLRRAFDQRYQRLRQMMGDQFDSSRFPPDRIRKNVLDNMINQAVMTQYARNNGYRVTDADLLARIRDNPRFQRDGQFSAARYKALLSQSGMAPAQYEARLRDAMMGGQVRALVAASAFAVAPQIDAAYRQAHEQRRIEVLTFDPAAYADNVTIDKKAIKTYYDDHPEQFMRAPRAKLAYVSLDADQLSPAAPDSDDLKQLYQAHESEFGTPARRSADEIRIPVGDDGAKARQTVQKVIAAANKGEALEQIAGTMDGVQFHPIDSQPQSALPEAVGSALFDLEQGALSNPVRGEDAWYVLRTTSITPAETPAFDDPVVQARLKAMARQQARAKAFRSKADKLDDLAYQAPNGLKTISNKLDLKIRHTDWINRDGGDSGLGQYAAVRKAAFSDAVLKDHLNSEVIDLGKQRRVVLRVTDHEAARRRPLAEVRDTIHDRLVAQTARQRAEKAARQAMAKARQGATLSEVERSEKGTKLIRPGFVGRDNDALDARVLKTAFDLPAVGHSSDDARYRVAATRDGHVALVAVSATRVETDKAGSSGPQRKQIARQQAGLNARLEYSALGHYLREQTSVDIHENAMN